MTCKILSFRDEADWLNHRFTRVTASDIPVILGRQKHCMWAVEGTEHGTFKERKGWYGDADPELHEAALIALWEKKKNRVVEDHSHDFARWMLLEKGKHDEIFLREKAFERFYGKKCHWPYGEYRWACHDDGVFMATLDGITDDGQVCEFKTGGYSDDNWSVVYGDQVRFQMAVPGLDSKPGLLSCFHKHRYDKNFMVIQINPWDEVDKRDVFRRARAFHATLSRTITQTDITEITCPF